MAAPNIPFPPPAEQHVVPLPQFASVSSSAADGTVPVTTRPMRLGEQHGCEYYFVSKSQFVTMVSEGVMVEFGEYKGHLYGTPQKDYMQENFIDYDGTAAQAIADDGGSTQGATVSSSETDGTVPVTTRPMRLGEQHGREYYFISKAQFDVMVSEGVMVEFGEYKGHLYGTSQKDFIQENFIDSNRPASQAIAGGNGYSGCCIVV